MPRYAVRLLPALLLLLALPACDSIGGEEPNKSPVAGFSFSPNGARAGTEVAFANQSNDPDGQIESYSWDFDGDGVEDDSRRNPSFAFHRQGNYTATLTVTDDRGGTDTTSEAISVSARFNSVTITGVAIEDIPFSDAQGRGWDGGTGTGPDIYYEARNAEGARIVSKSTYYKDVTRSMLPIGWRENFTISDLSERYEIHFYDYDPLNSDDRMGYVWFRLERYAGRYPSSALVGGDERVVRLKLKWGYDKSVAAQTEKPAQRLNSSPPALKLLDPVEKKRYPKR